MLSPGATRSWVSTHSLPVTVTVRLFLRASRLAAVGCSRGIVWTPGTGWPAAGSWQREGTLPATVQNRKAVNTRARRGICLRSENGAVTILDTLDAAALRRAAANFCVRLLELAGG